MSNKTTTFGLHLMIDAYGIDPLKLADVTLLFNTLNRLPEKIGMRKLGVPQIAEVDEKGKEGISGMLMIYESHISIHTFPKREYLSMDLYSCKPFDSQQVIAIMRAAYAPKELETREIPRGTMYPASDLHE